MIIKKFRKSLHRNTNLHSKVMDLKKKTLTKYNRAWFDNNSKETIKL